MGVKNETVIDVAYIVCLNWLGSNDQISKAVWTDFTFRCTVEKKTEMAFMRHKEKPIRFV